ncbi:hypothetical protein GCM10020258_12820 [Sphingomonas yabuuchiae]
MTPAQTALLQALTPILGDKGIVTDPALIAPWEVDWRRLFRPCPRDPRPRRYGTGAGGAARGDGTPGEAGAAGGTARWSGATPPDDGSALILSMRRMNRIRRMDADAGMVVAEAGVILADLHAAAEAEGVRFPLTLGAKGNATVGGLVSTNAGVRRCCVSVRCAA